MGPSSAQLAASADLVALVVETSRRTRPPVPIHQRVGAQEVDACVEVLHADGGALHEARFTGAVAEARGVEAEGDPALLGEELGGRARGLHLGLGRVSM